MDKYTIEQVKEMNIYEKLQNCRVMMQEEGIKKLGKNTFAKYDYYKLADLNATMNRALREFRLCTHFQISEQIAILTVLDVDKPESELLFTMPFIDAEMSKVTKIQNWGSSVSYLQRYLILEAFQIGEAEIDVDSTEASENREGKKSSKKAQSESNEQTKEVGETLESVKQQVKEKCTELAKKDRAKVNETVLKYHTTPNPSGIKDIEVLKKLLEELNTL